MNDFFSAIFPDLGQQIAGSYNAPYSDENESNWWETLIQQIPGVLEAVLPAQNSSQAQQQQNPTIEIKAIRSFPIMGFIVAMCIVVLIVWIYRKK